MNYAFSKNSSLSGFQGFIDKIYAVADDHLFSLPDLISNQERFTMRAIKGIRKKDRAKLTYNLLIAFSWLMAIANRLHIDLEESIWARFPMRCSYCGKRPCLCKEIEPEKRVVSKKSNLPRPKTLAGFQKMFGVIYPARSRTLADAGIHLAEEAGEVSETVHVFLGEHKREQFDDIATELADYVSCMFGVANSANIDLARELGKMFRCNCHICHKAPCACEFSSVAKFKS